VRFVTRWRCDYLIFDGYCRAIAPIYFILPLGAPHPIPYLRVFISIELLRRMGFPETAEKYRQIWQRLYPNPRAGNIPAELLKTFSEANHLVVDTICFTKYPQLGDKTIAEVTGFKPQHQRMIEEAGKRLAAGNDPGIIPERFL